MKVDGRPAALQIYDTLRFVGRILATPCSPDGPPTSDAGVDQDAIHLVENARPKPAIITIGGIASALEVRSADVLKPPKRKG